MPQDDTAVEKFPRATSHVSPLSSTPLPQIKLAICRSAVNIYVRIDLRANFYRISAGLQTFSADIRISRKLKIRLICGRESELGLWLKYGKTKQWQKVIEHSGEQDFTYSASLLFQVCPLV